MSDCKTAGDKKPRKTNRGKRGGRGRLRVNPPIRFESIDMKTACRRSRFFNQYCKYIEEGRRILYEVSVDYWWYLCFCQYHTIQAHDDRKKMYRKYVNTFISEFSKFNNYMSRYGIFEAPSPKSPFNEEIEADARFILGDLCDDL
jgi:hypothetical protein